MPTSRRPGKVKRIQYPSAWAATLSTSCEAEEAREAGEGAAMEAQKQPQQGLDQAEQQF